MSNETKLAVILHADVVGSTELVQLDERVAHERIRDTFLGFEKIAAKHGGVSHELRGDALVAEFGKASDAVTAALSFQADNLARISRVEDAVRPECRIGIALGEVIVADNTVTGAGVVLAQRLEQLAVPGGVCISAAIREALPGRLAVDYKDLGEQMLKGFERAQRVYAVGLAGRNVTSSARRRDAYEVRVERASIAVLPFDNLSSDPEQEFFADGMSEDIITALSRFNELFVIARNSTFTYKGTPTDVRAVAQDLNVRYVLEGSVRKAGDRIRVAAQLIEASSGGHLWANRFDARLDDIFDLQDELTEKIVAAIAPEVQLAEQNRSARSGNLDAWEHYHLGVRCISGTLEGYVRAGEHFQAAVQLDPSFGSAHAWRAMTTFLIAAFSPRENRSELLRSAHSAALDAVEVDDANAMARVALGRVLGAMDDAEGAERESRKAIELNPNLWWAHHALGSNFVHVNEDADLAIPALEMASRLNPRDPMRWATDALRGVAHRMRGEYDEAIRWGRLACQVGGRFYLPHLTLAATLALAGRIDEGRAALERARDLEPSLSMSFVETNSGLGPRPSAGLLEGLRLLGL